MNLSPFDYYCMSHYHFSLKCKGYTDKVKRDQENIMFLSWSIHTNNPYVKKHISFEEYIGGEKLGMSKDMFERLRQKQAEFKLRQIEKNGS